VAEFLIHENDTEQELLLNTDSDKAISSDSDRDIDTDTDSRHDKKSLLIQAVQLGPSFMFCQDHRTLRIPVVTILSL
jgi:hypothetical protein